MGRSSSRSRFRPRPSAANVDWSSVQDPPTATAGASTKTLLAGLTSTVNLEQTILRTRFSLHVRTDQGAATEDQRGALGFIIVTDDAFAAGATAIPGPITDTGADWFVYQPFQLRFALFDATGVLAQNGFEYMVDSKSKRVLSPTETIAFMVETTSDSDGITTALIGRILTRVRGTR